MAGTDMIMPQMYLMGQQPGGRLQRAPSRRWPAACRPSGTACSHLDTPIDFSTVRGITAGGAAVPQSLIEASSSASAATIIQGWGMTETSPLAAFGLPPARASTAHDEHVLQGQGRTGGGRRRGARRAPRTEVLPNDGKSVGEFEIRGPWVTGSYYKDEDPAKFHDGWLRTGDVGTLDPRATCTISDRTKDVIKSGGSGSPRSSSRTRSWPIPTSSRPRSSPSPIRSGPSAPGGRRARSPGGRRLPADLLDFLGGRVPRWWLPDQWTFVDEIPKTSVGKFDKKVMRVAYADGDYTVQSTPLPQ